MKRNSRANYFTIKGLMSILRRVDEGTRTPDHQGHNLVL